MRLYHASIAGQPDGICSHFGTLKAAQHRIDSVFSVNELRTFDGENFLVYASVAAIGRLPNTDQSTRTENPRQALEAYAKFMGKARLHQVEVAISNPLRLTDCWDNDPIGSAGLAMFQDSELSAQHRKELSDLFHPFNGVITPDLIETLLSPCDIAKMGKDLRANSFFKAKLEATRRRLGDELFKLDYAPEIVWAHKTMRLRQWALNKGYDGFIYRNTQEGDNDDGFVTLTKNQIKVTEIYTFDKDRFLAEAAPSFESNLTTSWKNRNTAASTPPNDLFWSQRPPENFWLPPEPPEAIFRRPPQPPATPPQI